MLSLLTCVCILVVFVSHIIPKLHRESDATSFYLSGDYPQSISILEKISTNNLTKDEAFVLSNSYVKTSNLSKEVQKRVLSKTSNLDNHEYNLFWIALSRMEFDYAYALANKYEDPRLLYFAYSSEYNSIDTNAELLDENSKQRKAELKRMIDEYLDNTTEKE